MEAVSSLFTTQAPVSLRQATLQPAVNGETRSGERFTEEELAEIARLKKRDQEVRAHEQAHRAAGGQYASAATFTYQRGPDGKNYAVGGEVQIDTSAVPGDPEATLRKAQQIQRAATAPAQPSSQDQSVAADAASMAIKARLELAQQQSEETGVSPEERENLAKRYEGFPEESQLLNILI